MRWNVGTVECIRSACLFLRMTKKAHCWTRNKGTHVFCVSFSYSCCGVKSWELTHFRAVNSFIIFEHKKGKKKPTTTESFEPGKEFDDKFLKGSSMLILNGNKCLAHHGWRYIKAVEHIWNNMNTASLLCIKTELNFVFHCFVSSLKMST